jgi:hypothetical protein
MSKKSNESAASPLPLLFIVLVFEGLGTTNLTHVAHAFPWEALHVRVVLLDSS